ncbi:hypothetical protein BaRGS_00012944, partial [Batillaria attramentaria]
HRFTSALLANATESMNRNHGRLAAERAGWPGIHKLGRSMRMVDFRSLRRHSCVGTRSG